VNAVDKGINIKLSLIAVFVAISAFATVLLLYSLTISPEVTGLASNELFSTQTVATQPSRVEPPAFYCRDKGSGYACRDIGDCAEDAGLGDCLPGQHCCKKKVEPPPKCSDNPGYSCFDPEDIDEAKYDCIDKSSDLCGYTASGQFAWCCKPK